MNVSLNYSLCDSRSEDVRQAFSFLSKVEAADLCPYLELREIPAEAIVMQEGAKEDYVGFLIDGKLAVKKKADYWDKHIIIAILEKGAMVGEGGFIDSGPRSNTVVAMEPSRLLTLTVGKMDELALNKPFLAIKIMKRMLYIMSIRLRKAGERISELL